MDNISVFRTPGVTIYGRDSFEKVSSEAKQRGEKALIISDPIMEQLGNVKQCIEFLNKENILYEVYTSVISEPTDIYVQESLDLFQRSNCDVIISLGGGSCIDTGKAVSILATNGGYIGDYMNGGKLVENQPIPHIAIPTTGGTGSEATDVTVITNTNNGEKMMIKQPEFMPSVAIVDPILTISSPKKVTAATGIDALCHSIEAYISRMAQPLTDNLALSAIQLITSNIKKAYDEPSNISSREAMSIAAMYGGLAFSNASVCLVHGMSRPLGAHFHVPHGESNAMLLPIVLEFSKTHCQERLAAIGSLLPNPNPTEEMNEEELANYAVEYIKDLCYEIQIPNLKDLGIDQQSFEALIPTMTTEAIRSGSPSNNPRVPSAEEIQELYLKVFNYQFSPLRSLS